nr:MAG: molybdate ABC transporter substrate-binding protein [Sphaerobacter thermophilus]
MTMLEQHRITARREGWHPRSMALVAVVAFLAFGLVLAGCGATAGGAEQEAITEPTGGAMVSATPEAAGAPTGEVTVFAAASLTDAFQEIGAQLEADNPGLRIVFNFAGSQALRAQLAEGARADVFASADEVTMEGAREDGSIAGEPLIFAQNQLVVILPADNPAGVQEVRDLARPGLKLVLADETVPAGRYARQVLAAMGQDPAFGSDFTDQALANVVSNETNVRQVVAKVQLGEADAGIVYASDVTPTVRAEVTVLDIPAEVNVVARYPIAIVQNAGNPTGAQAFIEAVLSPAGQDTLARHGFLPASSGGDQ